MLMLAISSTGCIIVALFMGAGLGKWLTDWLEVNEPVRSGPVALASEHLTESRTWPVELPAARKMEEKWL
jgi:hypothetical protein